MSEPWQRRQRGAERNATDGETWCDTREICRMCVEQTALPRLTLYIHRTKCFIDILTVNLISHHAHTINFRLT